MSLTVRDVVKRASRLNGALATGDDPSADELGDLLMTYNSLVRAMFGTLIGPRLSPKPCAASLQAENGGFYQVTLVATVTAPLSPRAGARFGVADAANHFATGNCTIAPNGQLIEGGTANIVLSSSGSASVPVSRVWFFRPDIGSWTREADALIDDTPYFPDALAAYLPMMLAVYSIAEYGGEVRPETLAFALEGRDAFARQYARRGRNQADAPIGLQSRSAANA